MFTLRNISYIHPNKDLLFDNINLTIDQQDKIALVGNNGTGKSTLLKIIADDLTPSHGESIVRTKPYYIPQIFGQYDHLRIAEALQIESKLSALKEILAGHVTQQHLNILDDDWSIEERCNGALAYWQLHDLDLNQKMGTLSGGQKTKVFLAGIAIHQPELILLDEPSNHLDSLGRQQLYDLIQSAPGAMLIVSHDRRLLNLLNAVYELGKHGIRAYGGNYDFYSSQKQAEKNTLSQNIQAKEKALRKAKEKERETLERQQKLDSRGKGKQEKAGVARIMMNTLRNSAENSTSKMKNAHAEKIGAISEELQELRSGMPDMDKMRFGFDSSQLHQGKILFTASNINFGYDARPLWKKPLSFEIASGERLALKGPNGSGKTTFIKLVLGELLPTSGTVYWANAKSIYIDQDYSLLENTLSVYAQAQQFNTSGLQEHEIKIRLDRFLFTKKDWDKTCSALSGGERMRLIICCLTIGSTAPDLIVLDEPTNNLDIQNIEILTAAINNYRGTLIVVSHDETFLDEINIQRIISP